MSLTLRVISDTTVSATLRSSAFTQKTRPLIAAPDSTMSVSSLLSPGRAQGQLCRVIVQPCSLSSAGLSFAPSKTTTGRLPGGGAERVSRTPARRHSRACLRCATGCVTRPASPRSRPDTCGACFWTPFLDGVLQMTRNLFCSLIYFLNYK